MLRAAGFLVGLAIVALALVAWRVPPGDGTLGADVTFFAPPARDGLTVSPSGPFAQRRGLEPGDAMSVDVDVRNSGRPTRIRLRAPADRPVLDRMLRVEATAGKRLLFQGRLAGLRRWTSRSFALGTKQEQSIRLRAWLPASVGERYRGRYVTLNLEFERVER